MLARLPALGKAQPASWHAQRHAQRHAPASLSIDAAMALAAEMVPVSAAQLNGDFYELVRTTNARMALDSLGNDLITFLAASVLVVPVSKVLKVTPVLGFLLLGCAIGPYGFGLFSNTEADIKLGDFGILFLLFIEGLNLSPDRLEKLGSFFQLGVSQMLLSIGFFFFSVLFLGPQLLTFFELFIPLDDQLLRPIFSSPVTAFCIAAAGALSSSAFALPVLKEKGWEGRADGIAALAVLLLQDLAVAPLLVIIPLLAGSGPQDNFSLLLLVAKATFGFGGVLALGSVVLRQLFEVVASSRSSETFVAATLLVAVGMGAIAEELGLSSTTGAFAAGVLLAGTKFRAAIEADIKPFEGILLGVFFLTAGATLDPSLVLHEWPTLLTGIIIFILAKAGLLLIAGESALGLRSRADAVRVAVLLSGGGEFAFIIFRLAENLGVLPHDLGELLTASVIISMSLTPLLGEAAEALGAVIERAEQADEATVEAEKLFDAIDTDGSGTLTRTELQLHLLGGDRSPGFLGRINMPFDALFTALDTDADGVISRDELRLGYVEMCTGGARVAALQQSAAEENGRVLTASDAYVVCGFGEIGQRVCDELSSVFEGSDLIAFDRDPKRVAVGMQRQVRVIYGDGASETLLKASGIEEPRAIIVSYSQSSRCLDATRRLRDVFPQSPIYVRAASEEEVTPLLEAGATEVVVETNEAAVRLARLLTQSSKVELGGGEGVELRRAMAPVTKAEES
jgi:Kef-type K+ transport system membrane component KefB